MDELRSALREIMRRLSALEGRQARVEERLTEREQHHESQAQWLTPWRIAVTGFVLTSVMLSLFLVVRAHYREGVGWEFEIKTAELSVLIPAIATAIGGLIAAIKMTGGEKR